MGKSLRSCGALVALTWVVFPATTFSQSVWSQVGGLNCKLAPTVGPLAVGLPLIIRALTSHPLRRFGDPTSDRKGT